MLFACARGAGSAESRPTDTRTDVLSRVVCSPIFNGVPTVMRLFPRTAKSWSADTKVAGRTLHLDQLTCATPEMVA